MINDLEIAVSRLPYEDYRDQKKPISELDLLQLRALIAYEYAKDGMEESDILEIWQGRNPCISTREQIYNELVDIFGY